MANIFQTSTGYRDPQKAMTIKALEARAKAAQDAATQSLQPTVVADPMQGIAGVLGTLGSQMQQGRAEADVSRSRNELAKLQAGITDYEHIDPNTLAQIGMLDPEQQKFLVERMLTIQNREDEQGFKAGESKAERDERARIEAERNALTASENAKQRGSTEGIAARGQEGENTRTDLTLANQRTVEGMREDAAAGLQTEQIGATADLEKQKAADKAAQDKLDHEQRMRETDVAKEYAAEAGGAYGTPGSPQSLKQRDANITAINSRDIQAPAKTMTPGQIQVDTEFAKDMSAYNSTGRVMARVNSGNVQQAIDLLEAHKNDPIGATAPGMSLVPGPIKAYFNPDGTIAKEAVQTAIQSSLKAVLGSQFTALESSGLMSRMFNEDLEEGENIRRAKVLLGQIKELSASMEDRIKYYDSESPSKPAGTTAGYTPSPAYQKLVETLTEWQKADTGGSGTGTGTGTGTGGDPAAAAAARKKKYSLED